MLALWLLGSELPKLSKNDFFAMKPEEKARKDIDNLLSTAGWIVHKLPNQNNSVCHLLDVIPFHCSIQYRLTPVESYTIDYNI